MTRENSRIAKMTGEVVWAGEKEHCATVEQVARWLAEGRGLGCFSRGGIVERDSNVFAGFQYQIFESFDFPGTMVIRKWDDYKWHEPTLEYMGIK